MSRTSQIRYRAQIYRPMRETSESGAEGPPRPTRLPDEMLAVSKPATKRLSIATHQPGTGTRRSLLVLRAGFGAEAFSALGVCPRPWIWSRLCGAGISPFDVPCRDFPNLNIKPKAPPHTLSTVIARRTSDPVRLVALCCPCCVKIRTGSAASIQGSAWIGNGAPNPTSITSQPTRLTGL